MRLNQHSMQAAVQMLITQNEISLSRVWCWPRFSCGYAACKPYWIRLYCLKLATACICSGPFWSNSVAELYQTLPVSSPGQLIWSNLQCALLNPSAGLGCMWKGPSCTPQSVFTSTMSQSTKFSSTYKSASDRRFLLG